MASNITLIEDEDLIFHLNEYDIILIGTGTNNAMGNGFQKKIALAFPYVDQVNKSTPYCDKRKLGTVKVIPPREGNPMFCLCYINTGRRRPDIKEDYLDYEALEKCLSLISANFPDKTIAMPFIGTSKYDGEGDGDKIWEIINKFDYNITIYNYFQVDWNDFLRKKYLEVKAKAHTWDYRASKKRYLWLKRFGEIKPYPDNIDDLTYNEIKKGDL